MKFFYSPGACSIGIRVILEETGAPYEAQALDFARGEQRAPAYLAVNPKGKVPALVRDDGSVLTEFQTIAFWLARRFPEAALLPRDLEAETRVMEALDYMVGSVHMRGFTLALVPFKFVTNPEGQAELAAHGRAQAEAGLAALAAMLGDKDWLLGRYSIADAALFYLVLWAGRVGIDLPEVLVGFAARMQARPAVARALAGEGLAMG